jgi:hypothetical protein
MNNNIPVGSNPLPIDAQIRLAEFLDWLDTKYETKQGVTSLFWELSYTIGSQIEGGRK